MARHTRHRQGAALRQALAQAFARLMRRRLPRLLLGYFSARLTPAGEAFVLLWAIAAIQGVANLDLAIYRLWAFVTVAMGVGWCWALVAVPRVRLARRMLYPTTAGADLVYEVEIENLSRRVAHALTVMELDLPEPLRAAYDRHAVLVPRLRPGEKAIVPLRVHCLQRGAYTLRRLCIASAFPFGLWRGLRRASQATSFLVYPGFTTPEAFPLPEGRQYQPGGILMSSNVGDSSEFMHTREYHSGDNPRHVHWASWARLGKPIVKVYQEEYFVRLALVIDTAAVSATEHVAFEAGISVAAGIADYLSRRDYIIDIFVAGATVYRFQAGRALAHFEHILEILACLEATPQVDWEAVTVSLIPEAPRLTAVVAILMDWLAAPAACIGQLQGLGVGVRTLVIRDGATSAPLPALPPELLVHLTPSEAVRTMARGWPTDTQGGTS